MRIILNFILLISLFLCIISDYIPKFFDSRIKWPNCVPKIYNQGSCGACYAVSVATAFSMRYCIRNNLPKIINFSAQNLVNCLGGCQGELPDTTWGFLNSRGITTEKCLSYKGTKRDCNSKCDSNNVKFNKYYAGETKYLVWGENEIKEEILKNGPVTTSMDIYSDYFNYKSGIYIHNKKYNKKIDDHSVTIMGWGKEDGDKYWLIQDSYGESKGENGFMKIKIGDCGVGDVGYCDEKLGKYNEYNEEDITKDITIKNTKKMSKDNTVENTNKMGESSKINNNKGNYINMLVGIKYFMIFISFIIF